ncbi:MAG: winged helix-turn-helix domain-containing tetratricopeptide repeat protein [Vicinamibacterales bacterium]
MSAPVVRFGEFEFDPRVRELRRGTKAVRLQDQPYHLLSMLLERPGDVVTRDAIQARLWPDGTAVDFEHSVNAAVKRLRNALGDDAGRPQYVETLPRLGYRFIAPLNAPEAPASAAPDTRPRLVVLPFVNLSGDVERDYFSDGLTEEMIAQLGRRCANQIGVLARTSSMLYKNVNRGAADIGGALRADYLVEGSVRVSGARVRVTAQLIETKGETHLWADSYDRDLSDGLSVQLDVASQIATTLTRTILPPVAETWSTHSTRAYETFLTGRFHWNKPGDAGLLQALACYDEALALDPNFGRAHSSRARAFLSLADYYRMDPVQALRTARAAAERALELDPSDAEAYVVLAEARRVVEWDWAGAEAAYRRALALNPNSEVAHRYYAWFLGSRAVPAAALAAADRAYDLDPLCLSMITCVGVVRYFARAFDAALVRARQALSMEPQLPAARRLASAVLVALGRPEDAVGQFDAIPEESLPPVDLAWKGYALASAGHLDSAREVRGRLHRLRDSQMASAYHGALLDVALQDHEAALASLAHACERRDPWLDAMAIDPRFEPLRADSRFQALCARLQRGCTAG